VSKNKQEKAFYSLPEFEEWKAATDNWHTWKIKYYKGDILSQPVYVTLLSDFCDIFQAKVSDTSINQHIDLYNQHIDLCSAA